MNNKPKNYSGIFTLFEHDKPDKTGAILQKIGKISFAVSFVASILLVIAQNSLGDNLPILNIGLGLFGAGFMIGVLMFIATGIHYSGRQQGKTSFLASTAYVLRNTFLYLFLPVFIITALVIIWAIVTKQPAFQ